jgi:hypothetical protein
LNLLCEENFTKSFNIFNNINISTNPSFFSSSKNFDSLITARLKKLEKDEVINNFHEKINLSKLKDSQYLNDHHFIKSDLEAILQKYHKYDDISKDTQVNTYEVRNIINNIENLIVIRHNDESKIVEENKNLEDYIKENEIIHTYSINKNLNFEDGIFDKTYDEGYKNLSRIPIYSSTFFKADYEKSKKITFEKISDFRKEFYLVDNREIFLINNFNKLCEIEIKSFNNGILSHEDSKVSLKKISSEIKLTQYKRLSTFRKSSIISVNKIIFKNQSKSFLSQTFSKSKALS